jgi:NAD(P)-dependent dehydrogenase (short-subunit alcohol dehydrogenase family)
MDLSNRTVVIAGGARNIGRGIVLEFAQAKANIVLNSRAETPEFVETLHAARKLGANVTPVPGDITDETVRQNIFAAAKDVYGGADVLVHAPSFRIERHFSDMTVEEWHQVMDLNLHSYFYLIHGLVDDMAARGWGRIIGFSGAMAFRAKRYGAHTIASKGAVVGLTRAIAFEYADKGVTANTIVPGVVATEKNVKLGLPSAPVGRFGVPEDFAKMCTYLCTDAGGFITGQSLHINGGVDFY